MTIPGTAPGAALVVVVCRVVVVCAVVVGIGVVVVVVDVTVGGVVVVSGAAVSVPSRETSTAVMTMATASSPDDIHTHGGH